MSDGRVERLWRRQGLKAPPKQPKRGRLWLNDGSCIRLRPEFRNHGWSYDFVHCRTDDGKAFCTLNIVDEFSRDCLAIFVKRKLNSTDVIEALTDLFILHGPPAFVRSENGPEFVAKDVRAWIEAVGAKTAYIEPGSPWENGYVESFNARFRVELLNREIFHSLREARSSSKAGGDTTIPNDHTARWATGLRHSRQTSQRKPGRSRSHLPSGYPRCRHRHSRR